MSDIREFTILQIQTGKVQPLGAQQVPSGINKQLRTGEVFAGENGLEGDEQADRRHHGGPDKAVHAYAVSNYEQWRKELPDRAQLFQVGSFGENLVVEGVTEANICMGDQWQVGDVVLEVSQSRQPCWKLNLRFDQPDMAQRLQQSGRSGWYFRVSESGALRAGDKAVLMHRPFPEWPLTRVRKMLYDDCLNKDELSAFAKLPNLPESWLAMVEKRLATGAVEDWSRRIQTPVFELR